MALNKSTIKNEAVLVDLNEKPMEKARMLVYQWAEEWATELVNEL